PPTDTYPLSLPDALPISPAHPGPGHEQLGAEAAARALARVREEVDVGLHEVEPPAGEGEPGLVDGLLGAEQQPVPVHFGTLPDQDRKSTRLNSSHVKISY